MHVKVLENSRRRMLDRQEMQQETMEHATRALSFSPMCNNTAESFSISFKQSFEVSKRMQVLLCAYHIDDLSVICMKIFPGATVRPMLSSTYMDYSPNHNGAGRGMALYQSLAFEHAFPNFPYYIFPIILANQDYRPSTAAHASYPAESMNEVNCGMRHIV